MDENLQIAERLREAAALLEAQGANPYRVAAYRNAAETAARVEQSLRTLFDCGGTQALATLPHIGRGIAGAIAEILITGRWQQLERLRGEVEPDKLQQDAAQAADGELPPVALLLQVDREYRDKARSGRLPKIAPKRFNPEGEAWLPVLHARHGGRHFTALYSNTARAHELGRTHDWVVIYCYDDHHQEGQCTVVTETRGAAAGRRVVRGREPECLEHYEASEAAAV